MRILNDDMPEVLRRAAARDEAMEIYRKRRANARFLRERLKDLRKEAKHAKALAYAAHVEALRLKREGHAYALECAARCPQPHNPARAAAAPEEDPFA